jgi:hypothetical protein
VVDRVEYVDIREVTVKLEKVPIDTERELMAVRVMFERRFVAIDRFDAVERRAAVLT